MAPPEHAWGSKNGSEGQPGYSPHKTLSVNSKFGPVTRGAAVLGSLIDAEGYIYLADWGSVTKMDDNGDYLWKVTASEQRKGFSSTPTLMDSDLFFATEAGWVGCINTKTGKERWCKQVCAGGCATDYGALGARQGAVIVAGKSAADSTVLRFNTDVFCINAKDGKVRWTLKMRLGLSNLVPSISESRVVIQSINGEVGCYNLADGVELWISKAAGQTSTGAAVISKETGLVYSTANLKGKKQWNMPFGGKGTVRAFDLKTGEVRWEYMAPCECNAAPAVAPVGPGGKALVIFAGGSNPGPWDKPTGDEWPITLIALDAKDGSLVWTQATNNPYIKGLGGTGPGPRFKGLQGLCCSSPVVGSDGIMTVGWHGCTFFQFRGETGEWLAVLKDQKACFCGISQGPDLLVLHSLDHTYIFRNRQIQGKIYRELDAPFSEIGYEHFWPHKMYDLLHTEYCELRATTKFDEAIWKAGHIEKHFARIPGADFYHKTPVVDSQRNVYNATNGSSVMITRSDGLVRGVLDVGFQLCNMCLHEQCLYVCNGAGYCSKTDIETLRVVWMQKYCDYTASDSWNPAICEKNGLILVVGMCCEIIAGQVGGNKIVFALDISDGTVKWHLFTDWVVYNFLPTINEEKDFVIFSDNIGGMYCLKISNGDKIWTDSQLAVNEGAFTTGHCASWNGMIFNIYCMRSPPNLPLGLWNDGGGGGGTMTAYVQETGVKKWSRWFQEEMHVAPVVVPKPGGEGAIVVCAQGSQGGFCPPNEPPMPPDDATDWPSGDAWQNYVRGFDAETGDTLWSFALPVWHHYEAAGSYLHDIFLPDCFGSPTANSDGLVFILYWSGVMYCFNGITGEVVAECDTGASSQSAIVILPGTVLLPNCYNTQAFRDPELEREWLEAARARGDRRADPRLWVPKEFKETQLDVDARTEMFHYRPSSTVHPTNTCVPIKPPDKRCDIEVWRAKCLRLLEDGIAGKDLNLEDFPAYWPGGVVTKTKEKKPLTKPAAAPAAAAAAPNQQQAADGEKLWDVVGGGTTGGIMVRKDQSIKSAELGRLSNGSRLKQLGLKGDRLHYQKLSGDGPDFGWVSLSFKGTPLVQKV